MLEIYRPTYKLIINSFCALLFCFALTIISISPNSVYAEIKGGDQFDTGGGAGTSQPPHAGDDQAQSQEEENQFVQQERFAEQPGANPNLQQRVSTCSGGNCGAVGSRVSGCPGGNCGGSYGSGIGGGGGCPGGNCGGSTGVFGSKSGGFSGGNPLKGGSIYNGSGGSNGGGILGGLLGGSGSGSGINLTDLLLIGLIADQTGILGDNKSNSSTPKIDFSLPSNFNNDDDDDDSDPEPTPTPEPEPTAAPTPEPTPEIHPNATNGNANDYGSQPSVSAHSGVNEEAVEVEQVLSQSKSFDSEDGLGTF